MKDNVFLLNIEDFEIGKPIIEYVDFPSFYGLQKVKAPIYIYRASEVISPCLVVTACMHGDEINGMRIAQSLMKSKFKLTKGTLIIFPVVNIYGFLNKVRYLPDRKDLNRCFPGINQGSFGSRFAKFIFENTTRFGDVFIDLHSGGVGRFNIPQIRCDLNQEGITDLINATSIPLVVNSTLRDGSFREVINDLGKQCIVFEGGEGLRIDETITKYGVNLIRSILGHLGMLKKKSEFIQEKIYIKRNRWIRAKEGGILINKAKPGNVVKAGEVIGELRQITGELISRVTIEHDGVILGMSRTSMIMSGDALYNIGFLGDYANDLEEEFFDYFEL